MVQSNQMQQKDVPSFCSRWHKMAKYLSNKCNVVDISMNKYNIYQIFIRKVALIDLIYLRDLF